MIFPLNLTYAPIYGDERISPILEILSQRILPLCLSHEQKLLFEKNYPITPKEHRFDLQTPLDLKCENMLKTWLRKIFPDDLIIGEESDKLPKEGDSLPGSVTVIDPVDGTLNFTTGNFGQYGIMVSRWQWSQKHQDYVPWFTSIFYPGEFGLISPKLIYAYQGEKPIFFIGEHGIHGRASSPKEPVGNNIRMAACAQGDYLSLFHQAGIVPLNYYSSAYHYFMAALGRVKMIAGGKNYIWDMAAGVHILGNLGWKTRVNAHVRTPFSFLNCLHGKTSEIVFGRTEELANQALDIIQ